MPFFFVDDGFSNSKEVMSIPTRSRTAAIGLWTLCGAWSMANLTDGFVPRAVARQVGDDGKGHYLRLVQHLVDASLWEVDGDGWRFRNWARWQRSRASVLEFRQLQRDRKRRQRSGKTGDEAGTKRGRSGDEAGIKNEEVGDGNTTTSDNTKMSRTCHAGHDQPTPVPVPKRTTTYVDTQPHQSNARAPDGRAVALARIRDANLTARSPDAYRIAEAFSISLAVPIEPGLLSGIGVQIDKCLKSGIPPLAIANGLRAWTDSDSFAPSQIPNFVHKANNRNGKATAKALGYAEAANQLIKEMNLK